MARASGIDARITRLAGQQHGVVCARQLRGLGIGRQSVYVRIRDGRLHRVFGHVYSTADPSTGMTVDAKTMAAVLGAGDGSAASHETAARLHGIWERAPEEIHVVSTRRHAPLDRRIVRRTTIDLPTSALTTVMGIPATTVMRTCMDLGTCVTTHQLAWIIGRCVFQRMIDVRQLEVSSRERGGSGTATVRSAIQLHRGGCAGTRSRTEDRFLGRVIDRGLVSPVVNTLGATGRADLEPDFVWPRRRLVVELDGAGHRLPGAAERDAALDQWHREHGWQVARVPAARVWQDCDAVVRQLEAWLCESSPSR